MSKRPGSVPIGRTSCLAAIFVLCAFVAAACAATADASRQRSPGFLQTAQPGAGQSQERASQPGSGSPPGPVEPKPAAFACFPAVHACICHSPGDCVDMGRAGVCQAGTAQCDGDKCICAMKQF